MVRKLVTGLSLLLLATAVVPAGEPEITRSFVGASHCGQCHPQVLAAWKRGPHARANSRLPEANRTDPRCLRCHGTSDAATGGVQCESCHGPGRIYARRHVMKDRVLSRLVGLRDAELDHCSRCHTETGPRIQPFLPQEAWKKITHP